MGILLDELASKYSAKNPPLAVEAGIRQESGLDARSQLAFANVAEMDAHIGERLATHEKIAASVLQTIAGSAGMFFPLGEADLVRLLPSYSAEQRESVWENIVATAAEAIEQYTLGDLYLKASERNPEVYGARAAHFLGDKSLGRKGAADITLERATLALQSLMQNAGIGASEEASKVARTTFMVRDWGDNCGEYRARRRDGFHPNG